MATTNVTTATVEGAGIDHAISSVENLYRKVTGQDPPPSAESHAPMPVEKDPGQFVEEQLERLLAMLDERTGVAAGAPPWSPLLTVLEDENEITVLAELPGVEHKDVEVLLEGNVLSLRGRRTAPWGPEKRPRLAEWLTGPFARRVLLPPTARFGEPKAQLKHGVLEVRLGKEPPARPSLQPVPIH